MATTDMNRHFGVADLLRLVAPAIVMMMFTSVYAIVDGLFISNFAGKTSFAAVNFVMPLLMILSSVGFMMGAGGSAQIALAMGSGDSPRANRLFSLVVYVTLALGGALALVGALCMEQVLLVLGCDEEMLPYAVVYGRISMVSLPLFMLQTEFQTLVNTAGKPKLGLVVTVCAGITNMVLDALFVGVAGWGVQGAAWATVISEFIGGGVPLVYFARKNSSHLRLGRAGWDGRSLGKICVNGSSEMMSNVAFSLANILYNFQLMRYIGQDGVAAYGILMYVGMIFSAVLMGYNMGVSPLMSFQHGARNNNEKQSLFRKSLLITAFFGGAMCVSAELAAPLIAWAYGSYDPEFCLLIVHATRLYMTCMLITGFNFYASALFTSLGNGVVSAIISFVRTLVCECGCVLILPLFLGVDGIWVSFTVAEALTLIMSASFVIALGKHYRLFKVHED